MKWCFLVNDALFLSEFMGKLAEVVAKEGNACLVLFNSKIAEYEKKKHFPLRTRFISKVDWCIEHYNPANKEFGELSWREFFPIFDRFARFPFLYSYSVDMAAQLYQFFDFIFSTEQPAVIIGEPPAGLFGEVAYYFAKKKNILFVGITDSRMENIAFYDSEWTDSRYEKTFKKLLDTDISKKEKKFFIAWLQGFLTHTQVPSYTKYIKISFRQTDLPWHYFQRIKKVGLTLLKYIVNRKRFQPYDYESEAILRYSLMAPVDVEKRQVRLVLQKKFFRALKEGDKFFVYPLHFQPESATSVLAMYYADQLATIRNIAFALPFPWKLYVKEHVAALGTRPSSFYEYLQKIPQVVLISARESVPKLIQRCSGVITLTSTMGMEAALSGKPVYVLGNVFYAYHPLCKKAQNFDDLREHIRIDMTQKHSPQNLERINMRFLASYYRHTVPGITAAAQSDDDRNDYDAIYQAIKARVER